MSATALQTVQLIRGQMRITVTETSNCAQIWVEAKPLGREMPKVSRYVNRIIERYSGDPRSIEVYLSWKRETHVQQHRSRTELIYEIYDDSARGDA